MNLNFYRPVLVIIDLHVEVRSNRALGSVAKRSPGMLLHPLSWETVPLDNAHPRKLYGQEVNELYRTLKKIQRMFSREQEADPFSPARGRYFLTG